MPRHTFPLNHSADLKPHCSLSVSDATRLHPLLFNLVTFPEQTRVTHYHPRYRVAFSPLSIAACNRARQLIASLTHLKYIVHAATFQQSDASPERQPRLVAVLPAASDLLPAGVEGRVHADLPLAPRERPVNDASLHGLRDPLEALLHPLKRPLLRDFPRRDIKQSLRAVSLARFAENRSRSAARSSRGPLALPTCCAVAESTAESLGWGLLDALRHDSSGLAATEEVNTPCERRREEERLLTARWLAVFYGNMGAGLLRACQTPLLTNEGKAEPAPG